MGAKDRIVEIAIVDDEGDVLLETLVNPQIPISPGARNIHGISAADVRYAPTLEGISDLITASVREKIVVIYNAEFDLRFIPLEIISKMKAVFCCMKAYAELKGQWNPRFGNYRWFSLDAALRQIGSKRSGSSHRALSDAAACRNIWHYVLRKNGIR
jgi:DNA polymerase-3 subunit epsilon